MGEEYCHLGKAFIYPVTEPFYPGEDLLYLGKDPFYRTRAFFGANRSYFYFLQYIFRLGA